MNYISRYDTTMLMMIYGLLGTKIGPYRVVKRLIPSCGNNMIIR